MQRMLFVGCGGTGGSVLTYIMDQMRSEFLAVGLPGIPRTWGFVHVDVPTTSDVEVAGISQVEKLGGTYVSCTPNVTSYAQADQMLVRALSPDLEPLNGWIPEDEKKITVPIQKGAGQLRVVGRVVTLAAMNRMEPAIKEVWKSLVSEGAMNDAAAATAQMPQLGNYDPNTPPVIFVVSSMAGGAGASMVLDVCRVLADLPGANPETTALFLASAGVFQSLPEDARRGILPNALAMFGEIVAAQAGAAARHDAALLATLGLASGEQQQVPFARVFPIGNQVGAQGALFGDGAQQTVYRGLARALSAMAMSSTALGGFINYDITNSNPLPQDLEIFGWGAAADSLQWGAFGYGSLSMGRDRYLEYSAQRLARSALDHCLEGHLFGIAGESSNAAADARVQSRWEHVCHRLGIPSGRGPEHRPAFVQWAGRAFAAGAEAQAVVADEVESELPLGMNNFEAAQLTTGVTNALTRARANASARAKEVAYRQAGEWVDSFVADVQAVVDEEIAAFGLLHARRLVERLDSHLSDWIIPGLEAVSRRGVESPTTLPPTLTDELRGLRGVLAQTHSIMDKVRTAILGSTRLFITSEAQRVAAEALKEFSTGVASPLTHALSRALSDLGEARRAKGEPPGLAVMETNLYSLWPFDGQEKVDKRWGASVNEVLLTKAEKFGDLYPDHLARSVEDPGADRVEVRKTATSYVIRGNWPTTEGARAPGGLLSRRRKWVANALARRPGGAESDIPQPAEYAVDVTAAGLLERARAFVIRPGMAFEVFASESLRDYATDKSLTDSARAERELEIANAFTSVLSLSLPLVGVEDASVHGVHGQPGSVQFNLSQIPFGASALEGTLRERIAQTPNINDGFIARLANQNPFSTDQHLRRIDVFGSYKCYAPVAYTGVLDPIARQWAEAKMPQDREHFWRLRRARPLEAALPMSDAERRAMVGGWLVGRVLGAIVLPPRPYDSAVRIFDLEAGRWFEFPNPLLTPPRRFQSPDDWLPSVLESSLLAMTRYSDAPVGASLRPYQVLRRLWDQDPTGPTDVTNGMLHLAGQDNLESWVLGQISIPAGSSPIPDAENPRDRAAGALQYLNAMVSRVEQDYLRPDFGTTRAGKHARLSTRQDVVAAPFFRNIAPDVVLAARRMIEWLESTEWPASDDAATNNDVDWSQGGV